MSAAAGGPAALLRGPLEGSQSVVRGTFACRSLLDRGRVFPASDGGGDGGGTSWSGNLERTKSEGPAAGTKRRGGVLLGANSCLLPSDPQSDVPKSGRQDP